MSRKPFFFIAVLIILGGVVFAWQHTRTQDDPQPFDRERITLAADRIRPHPAPMQGGSRPFDQAKSTLNVAPAIVSGINDLGFGLLTELAKRNPNQNIFISPPSISTALTMAYNGARGKTKQAMEAVLGLKGAGLTLDEINRGNSDLIAAMENADPKARCAIANSIWAGEDIKFDPVFEKNMRSAYDAEFGPLDITAINAWVNRETRGKIPTILDDLGALDYLVLVNAIYFKGEWSHRFDKSLTKDGAFHLRGGGTKTVPMMHQKAELQISHRDGEPEIVRLPYGDGRLGMWIYCPRKTSDLTDRPVGPKIFDRKAGMISTAEANLTMPRFKLEYGRELTDPLKSLGMGIAFTGDADFSGTCSGSGWISGVVHKTFVEVNEEGTEAAAATAVMQVRGVMRTKSIVIDRPFFCAIMDEQTGLILFMGYVMDPQ